MKKTVTKTVHEGAAKKKVEGGMKRVAAYCRVSTLTEEQELSYESQCDYFTKLIEGDPNMTMVGIYGDHGASGLQAKKRPQLQALLQKARDGEIDVILVKSISRMARNAMELEETLNEMKEHDVVVIFEREGIRSDDPQCEMIVKFLAAIAQEESNSISQAVTWGHDKNNQLGRPTCRCPYGFRKKPHERGEAHEWEVFEPEAKMVRFAFNLAKARVPWKDIAKRLNVEQKKYPEAKQRNWNTQSVTYMLRNEVYMGDVLTNKSVSVDYLTKKRKPNEGEKEQFYLEDHHPAIVSRAVFQAVNAG